MSHNPSKPHSGTEGNILRTFNMWLILTFANDISIKEWHNIWIATKVLSLQCTHFVVVFTFLE